LLKEETFVIVIICYLYYLLRWFVKKQLDIAKMTNNISANKNNLLLTSNKIASVVFFVQRTVFHEGFSLICFLIWKESWMFFALVWDIEKIFHVWKTLPNQKYDASKLMKLW